MPSSAPTSSVSRGARRQGAGAVKGIPPENILIGATHTHSAPDCYGFPDGKGGTAADLKYLDSVCTRMAEAINEAAAKLQPASLKIATGEAKGKIAYNYYAEQLYDPALPRDPGDRRRTASRSPRSSITRFIPRCLARAEAFCSPDLIGPLYDRLQEQGAGIGIFMNSAQGGMVTADNRRPAGQRVAQLGGVPAHRAPAGRRSDAHRREGAAAAVAKPVLRRADALRFRSIRLDAAP